MDASEFLANPNIWAIGLAVVFGAIWLAILVPRGWRSHPLWLMFIAGVVLFIPAIVWVQVPLQNMTALGLVSAFGMPAGAVPILLMSIPGILLSGLVQEGAKLLPTAIYWRVKGKSLETKIGLSLGALVGAGFGVFEAQWIHNLIFANWDSSFVESMGVLAFMGFFERFFTVAFHIATGALTGWGLARGWGWQFYLLASGLHFLLNYLIIPSQLGMIDGVTLEIVIALFTVLVFGVIVWLRWYRSPDKVIVTAPDESAMSPLKPDDNQGFDIHGDNPPDTGGTERT